ncbi:hypothetical protein [Aquisalimonas asiatica]|uniref:Uncharacterized protein n=1 Tax=Aquisalimonas asiatica TaxID=406100 RepID=A0A1H8T2A9_9GAMM|nr:hypothetical protein [Aquisalimonas asiatica]SEO84663.1 hypothetical protein SAMN04488052_103347 [Aquisalimonas asiatica]
MHSFIHDTGAGFWLGHSLMVILMIAVFTLTLTGAYLLLLAALERRETDSGETVKAGAQGYAQDEMDREGSLHRSDSS